MKQKITLEIENDTGVEFEEVAECSKLRMGEYYVDIDGKVQRSDYTIVGCKCIVLTPKVDHELEEARKKFPVGSWFRVEDRESTTYKVLVIERLCASLIMTSDDGDSHLVDSCTPFPIPTWRCCESDKPKTQGRYYTRRKRDHAERDFDEYCGENWEAINPEYISPLDYEWLDEGGE